MSALFLIARLSREVAQIDSEHKKNPHKRLIRVKYVTPILTQKSNFEKVKGTFDLV